MNKKNKKRKTNKKNQPTYLYINYKWLKRENI